MNRELADAFFVVHAVNCLLRHEVVVHPDGDVDGDCCNIQCGPCAALKWYRDNNPETLNYLVRLTGSTWSWQLPDGSIDWAQIESRWDAHKGCSRVGGVWNPCEEEISGEMESWGETASHCV